MSSSPGKNQLQGPRPAQLKVSRSSSKFKKLVCPVVVYLKSPDVFHVQPEEFMGLVQHLTGKQENVVNNTSTSSSCSSNTEHAMKCDGSSLSLGQEEMLLERFDGELVDNQYPNNLCFSSYIYSLD
ncbi:VQ motif-containing protein [Euphorbia peplus]|nr:VQ motif-containing protein [Euphorbia peplus]